MECPICYDELGKTTITLSCNHKFHKECIHKAIYQVNNDGIDIIQFKRCPYCRTMLNTIDKNNVTYQIENNTIVEFEYMIILCIIIILSIYVNIMLIYKLY